jgi:hypothetical protein
MKRRKKLHLSAAALGVLGAAAAAWCLLGARGKAEHCGFLTWPCDPDSTIAEKPWRRVPGSEPRRLRSGQCAGGTAP